MLECTGRFLRPVNVMSPNSRPRADTTRPLISNVRPLVPPRNDTVDKSGTTRFASPPAWCAAAVVAPIVCWASAGAAAEIRLRKVTRTSSRPIEVFTVAFITPHHRRTGGFALRTKALSRGHIKPKENDGLYSEVPDAVVPAAAANPGRQGH